MHEDQAYSEPRRTQTEVEPKCWIGLRLGLRPLALISILSTRTTTIDENFATKVPNMICYRFTKHFHKQN